MKSLLLSLILSTGVSALADKMDLSEHDLVIQKLESVLTSVSDKPETLRGIEMRLGDLYSERARIKAVEEGNKNCEKCVGSKDDRAKAIGYYDSAFNGATGEQQTKILLQKAHLFQINGDFNKSESVYEEIIKRGEKITDKQLFGEALAGRGEANYRKGEFLKAKNDFEKALKFPISKRSFIRYRLSWCLLNEGKAQQAKTILIGILTGEDKIDLSFRKDLSRDLATFLARGTISNSGIDELLNNSPDDVKKSNLFYMGAEADRLSNAAGSLLVWKRYTELGNVTPLEALEIKIRVTQTRLDQGFKKEALELMADATATWKKQGCKEADTCEELRLRLRNFVLTWNKKEKINPSPEVLTAYGIYVGLFDQDYEMIYWSAQLARSKNQLPLALKYYRQSGDVTFARLTEKNLDAEVIKAIQKIKEGSLLSEIEIAESLKDLNSKELSYNRYLKMNSNGAKVFEVRYQLAHVYSEKGLNKKAAESFYDLALDKNGKPDDLRVKSADLALDSLALLKDNETLEQWAVQFAGLFPAKKLEYLGIARKASVNQAVSIAQDTHASDAQLRKALEKLKAAPLQGATLEEKVLILKNQIVVAEKLKDIALVSIASSGLLHLPKLSKEDKEFALSRKVWVAELRLDFKDAFKTAKTMEMKDLKADQKALRLALLSELSGQNPTSYYEQALHLTKEREKRSLIIAKITKLSKNPWRTMDQNFAEISKTPHVLAPLTLEVFARSQDYQKLEHVLKIPSVRSTPAGQTLSRYTFLKSFTGFETKISSHRLLSGSDQTLNRTLTERLKLLNEADRWANQAIQSNDWTLQILTLNRVAKENNRLFENLTKLPTPRSLKKAEREQYQTLLLQKAQPFQQKTQSVETKLATLWNQSGVINQMVSIIAKSSSEIRSLLAQEISRLLKVSPDDKKSSLQSLLADAHKHRDHSDLREATADLKQNPFDESRITRLKNLEDTDGSPAMSTFLEARLTQLHQGAMR